MDNSTKLPEDRACDPASIETIEKAKRDCVDLSFFRMDQQKNQCTYGTKGLCCRICHMGPCRITAKSPLGVCGADADTIVARNFLREVAGGSACPFRPWPAPCAAPEEDRPGQGAADTPSRMNTPCGRSQLLMASMTRTSLWLSWQSSSPNFS